jgi:hypothetical protein
MPRKVTEEEARGIADALTGFKGELVKNYPRDHEAFAAGFARGQSRSSWQMPSWLQLPTRIGLPLVLVQVAGFTVGLNGHPLLGALVAVGAWLVASPYWLARWWSARRSRIRAESIARTPEVEAWHARYDQAIKDGLGLAEAIARADQNVLLSGEAKRKPKIEAEGTLVSRPAAAAVANGSVFVERDTGRTMIARDGVWTVLSPQGLEPPNLSPFVMPMFDTVKK